MDNINKIFDKQNNPALKIFSDFIKKEAHLYNDNFSGKLDELHKYLKIKDVNDFRIKLFTKINKSLDWEKLILKLIGNEIFTELGQDLLIQSKINLSIQMPKDKTSILPAHSDSWSADSPFQRNLWLPLTDAFGTNSMFILGQKETINFFKKIKKDKLYKEQKDQIKIQSKHFIEMSYGSVLLFNPALLHGNVLNKTNKTRISLNIRLKSIFSPEPNQRNPDRKYGTYYKKFNISENTKFATDVLKTGILE